MEQLLSSADGTLSTTLNAVLSKLLLPDTDIIEKATAELRELNKSPSFVPSLFSVLCQSDDAEIRKLASIIFRRKVSKQWKSLNREVCLGVRRAILERILIESNNKVSQSLCQVAASIAKHELSQVDGTWGDLFDIIQHGIDQAESRQTGVYLLSVVCDQANEKLQPHFINILKLLHGVLGSGGESDVYAIKAFDALVPYLGDEYVNLVRPLVLKCVNVIQTLLQSDEDRAAELMEIFETLIETEVTFISPYVKDLVVFSLQIASKSDFEDATRVRALSTLRWIIKLKKKAIIKLGLVEPILDSVIPIVTSPCDEDEISFASDEVESELPVSSATYIIDELALHLSPERLYKVLMPKIEALVQSKEASHRRGLVLILACLAEGTSEYIKNNYMKSFLEIVCRAALDDNPSVRNASLFAIGQFSEHLQPNVSEYAAEVMPLLFQILQKTSESSKGITRAYYALENFAENLEGKILPYLEQLVSHLLQTLSNCEKIHTKELAVSTIGAVANAAKEELLPYLGDILSKLTVCLPSGTTNDVQPGADEMEDFGLLHMQTLDTLGVLARNVGKANFLPLADDCLKLGMSLMENETNDPDMRRSAYGLFSALSTIVEEKMAPFLDVIVKHMLDSIRSTEGVVPHFTEETNGETMSKDFSFLDDGIERDLTTEDEDDDIEGFSVGNSYMAEKADSCEAIGEIAKHTKQGFSPFLALAFEEVFSVVDFPHPDVRKSAIATSGELTMCAYKSKHESFGEFLSQLLPVICKTIAKESERMVVLGAIATVNQMAECCGTECFAKGEESLKELMESLLLVMNGKSACQDSEDDVDEAQEEWLQAEYDEMLIEYCGEILPALAKSIGTTFLPYFIAFLPGLLAKTKSTCTMTERSFSAGTIAETFQRLGPGSSREVVGHIVPRFLELTRDSADEVRNNSIFGLGIVLQQAGEVGVKFYPTVLDRLSQTLLSEQNRGVMDNILGAVARMIMTNKANVPMSQVVPVLLSHLPIQEDHDEDATVYSCLSCFLHDDLEAVVKIQIISLFLRVMEDEKVDQEIRISVTNELRSTQQRDPALISQACEVIGPELVARLQVALQT